MSKGDVPASFHAAARRVLPSKHAAMTLSPCVASHESEPSVADPAGSSGWTTLEREDPRTAEILSALNDVFDAFAEAGPFDSQLNLSPA